MFDSPIALFAAVGAAGLTSQWLAWRFNLPAIVVMLMAGLLLGPATGLIAPPAVLGDLLDPLVTIAVALILFEGALNLEFNELRSEKPILVRLIGLGVPLAWVLGALAAWAIAGIELPVAIFVGAILIVTGPTVIVPILREARISKRLATILKWEGILNDPLGVLLAVFSFEVIHHLHLGHGIDGELFSLLISITLAASFSGLVFGLLVVTALRKGLLPEHLKTPFIIGAVLVCFALGAALEREAGLLAITIMGVLIANARLSSLTELRRFKESVSVLLISGVFILLTASLSVAQLQGLDWRILLFAAAVMVIVRPATVLAVTAGSDLSWRERLFLGWVAPRGIVVFAIAGVFSIRMVDAGFEDGERLVPLAFAFVVATVVANGLTTGWMARRFGLAAGDGEGVLIVGSSAFSRALAQALHDHGRRVCMADSNWWLLREPRMAGLATYYGEVLSDQAGRQLGLERFDHLVASSRNHAYNSLLCADFTPELGRENVFQIAVSPEDIEQGGRQQMAVNLLGQPLTSDGLTYDELEQRIQDGWSVQFVAEGGAEPADKEALILAALYKSGIVRFGRRDQNGDQAELEGTLWLAPNRDGKGAPAGVTPDPGPA